MGLGVRLVGLTLSVIAGAALLLLRKTLSTMNSFPPDCEKGVHYLVVSVIAQPVESL